MKISAMQSPMETIVTPERTVQRIADRSALEEFVERRNIGWQLAGNLRQLRGFDLVGNDRQQRKKADNYFLLEDVKFLRSSGSPVLVALIGTVAQRLKQFQVYEPDVDPELLKNLLNTKRKKPLDGWSLVVGTPPVALELADGASIDGLSSSITRHESIAPTLSVALPDYSALNLGAVGAAAAPLLAEPSPEVRRVFRASALPSQSAVLLLAMCTPLPF